MDDLKCMWEYLISKTDANFIFVQLFEFKNFFIYRLEDQILSEKKELYIGLVDPEYYPYSTNGENEYKIKFDEVFKLQTGYSGSIPILKKWFSCPPVAPASAEGECLNWDL